MSVIAKCLKNGLYFTNQYKFFNTSISKRNLGAYEGHGKTVANILNNQYAETYMISSFSSIGFRLTNDAFVLGPMIIIGKNVFFWNVFDYEDINEKSLEFFYHLSPAVDLLVLGFGDKENVSKLDKFIHTYGKKNGILIELLPTEKAVGTYNFIAENRLVAGAFIPPRKYTSNTTDMLFTKDKFGILEGRDTFQERPDTPTFHLPKDMERPEGVRGYIPSHYAKKKK